MSDQKPEAIIAEVIDDHRYSIITVGQCICGENTDNMSAHQSEAVVERLREAGHTIVRSGGMEIVPKGTSAALGAFAQDSVTKQRVLEDIAYVLTGWRYEDPEDIWDAVAKVARDKGNRALVAVVKESYAVGPEEEG